MAAGRMGDSLGWRHALQGRVNFAIGVSDPERALAEAAGVPAYIVFPDRTLIEMAKSKPVDLWALRSVHGVGERKREAYGERFAGAIKDFLSQAPAP